MTDRATKRPWFQFHLSTALVMMIAAGGAMWLELPLRFSSGAYIQESGNGEKYYWAWETSGWPIALYAREVQLNPYSDGAPKYARRTYVAPLQGCGEESCYVPFLHKLYIDLIAMLFSLCVIGFFCERWIYWREVELSRAS